MKQAICEEAFENLDLVKLLAGMRDLILQQALSHHYGTLVFKWNFLVASEATVQQLVANLRETEHRGLRHNVRAAEEVEYFQLTKLDKLLQEYPNQAPYKRPRNMFIYLIWARVAFAKVLLPLRKQLRHVQKFQTLHKRTGVQLIYKCQQEHGFRKTS